MYAPVTDAYALLRCTHTSHLVSIRLSLRPSTDVRSHCLAGRYYFVRRRFQKVREAKILFLREDSRTFENLGTIPEYQDFIHFSSKPIRLPLTRSSCRFTQLSLCRRIVPNPKAIHHTRLVSDHARSFDRGQDGLAAVVVLVVVVVVLASQAG